MGGRLIGLIALALGSSVHAEPPERISLSVDPPVTRLPAWPVGERLVVEGTLTNGIDGVHHDALGAWSAGSWVGLSIVLWPSSLRLVESDPERHRYVLEVTESLPGEVIIDVGQLAAAHWVTTSEMRSRLRGEISVSSEPPAAAPPSAVVRARSSGPLLPGVAALASLCGLQIYVRRRPAARLRRRALRALSLIDVEVAELGPAFDQVAVGARQLWDSAGRPAMQQAREAGRAIRRRSAARDRLRKARDQAMRTLHGVVEVLEAHAESLACHRTHHSDPESVSRAMAGLEADLGISLDADREASSLGGSGAPAS